MSIAIDAVSWWQMRGHRWDFLMYSYLNSLNAFDLPLNVWPPECVVHDTDPHQLLRSNCYLPMDSLVGMSIGGVKIYTWHELETLHLSVKLLSLTLSPSHNITSIYSPSGFLCIYFDAGYNLVSLDPEWIHHVITRSEKKKKQWTNKKWWPWKWFLYSMSLRCCTYNLHPLMKF